MNRPKRRPLKKEEKTMLQPRKKRDKQYGTLIQVPAQLSAELAVRELNEEELSGLFPVVRQLNPRMDRKTFDISLAHMRRLGYRAAGIYHEGRCLALTGFWELCKFHSGPYIEIDNLVVDEAYRDHGLGQKLLAWVEEYARSNGFNSVMCDSYLHNAPSHKFYFRGGYRILGFHFIKEL